MSWHGIRYLTRGLSATVWEAWLVEQDAFDLIWVTLFVLVCLGLPILLGLVAVLVDRE